MSEQNLTRLRPFEGLCLTSDDLLEEQDYHRSNHHRHNLYMHGHGIVQGLQVEIGQKRKKYVGVIEAFPVPAALLGDPVACEELETLGRQAQSLAEASAWAQLTQLEEAIDSVVCRAFGLSAPAEAALRARSRSAPLEKLLAGAPPDQPSRQLSARSYPRGERYR